MKSDLSENFIQETFFRNLSFSGRFYKILGALGASFFALSDSILGINKFRFPVPGADYSILATYYVGQLLIALSVIDDQNHQRSQGGEVE